MTTGSGRDPASVPVPLDRDRFLRSLIRELAGTLEDVVGVEEAKGYFSVVGGAIGTAIDSDYRTALQLQRLDRAQTAAVLVVRSLGKGAAGKLVYFMTIENARFRKPVTPGDQLRIHVAKDRSRGNVWKFNGEAKVEGRLVAEATFAAMLMDR